MSELIDRDKEFVWHPFTQHLTAGSPLPIVSANGCQLYAEDGKSYIDANSSWWVNVHGHGHPHIGKALKQQFETLDHVVFANVTHPKAVELAERLSKWMPKGFNKTFFSDNGSTAVEVALKMAKQYWYNKGEERNRFVAIDGAYHGDTFGAMSVGERDLFNRPFESLFFDVDYLPFPGEENKDEFFEMAEKFFCSGEIAAMIVEPLVQGASGMRIYTPEILDTLTLLARKNNVLIIYDEVMTGFGRTGKMFAMDHCKLIPDIVTLSKGLTGGILPMGITMANQLIFETFLSPQTEKGLLHGHSFTGNPLACAAACASLDLFDQRETWNHIESVNGWHSEFKKELEQLDHCTNVRLLGTILAFDIIVDSGSGYFSEIRKKAYEHFIAHGVLLRPLGNVVFFNPPYSISKEEYKQVKSAIRTFLETLN